MAATLPSPSSSFYIIAKISPEELLTVSCAVASRHIPQRSFAMTATFLRAAQEPTFQKELTSILT